MKIRILSALLIMLLTGCQSNNADKQTITVAAASSLSDAMIEIVAAYEKQADLDITLHIASSGVLANQIKQGAPIDVFLSASNKHFHELEEEGLIDSQHQVELLRNNLILIAKKEAPTLDWRDLSSSQTNRIAIGTPETVPAGAYAKQALVSLNLWEDLQDKLIFAKDVRQVLTYVETGNADAGFVYESDLKVSKNVKLATRIDQENYLQISYPAGVITGSPKSAEGFFDFLQSDSATKIFENYGFKRNE